MGSAQPAGDLHGSARSGWKASQRPRILDAICRLVADQGYSATTVRDIAREAGVSLTTFYEHFTDKETCLLEACDERAQELLGDLYAAATEPSWTDALRRGMRLYLEWWAKQPGFGAAYLVELPTAGRRALEQRDSAHAQFAAMFTSLAVRARSEQRRLPPLPTLAPRVLTAGITELVGQLIREGRATELPSLEDELVYLVIRILADERTANRERQHFSDHKPT